MAPREYISFSISLSTLCTPLCADKAATTTVMANASATFEKNPIPSRMTSTGASASFGMAFSRIRNGSLIPANLRDHQKERPSSDPIRVPPTKPRIVELEV
ncbi:hypothetical protein D3C80_1755790 [compost metagenome]